MLELMKFIFSNFWIWLGVVVLALVMFGGTVEVIRACKRNRTVETYTVGSHRRVKVENESRKDIKATLQTPEALTEAEKTGSLQTPEILTGAEGADNE